MAGCVGALVVEESDERSKVLEKKSPPYLRRHTAEACIGGDRPCLRRPDTAETRRIFIDTRQLFGLSTLEQQQVDIPSTAEFGDDF